MLNNNELKKLTESKRLSQLQTTKLPSNAKLVDSKLKCLDCFQYFLDLLDFKNHLHTDKHKKAAQVLKRKAQVDIQSLENESLREEIKPKKLTREAIQRINAEVDKEFEDVMKDVEIQKQNKQDLLNDFFDKIEIEAEVQKQLKEQKEKEELEQQQQQQNNDELEVDLEQLKQRISRQKKIQQKDCKLYNFIDDYIENDQEEFVLNWKQKS